MSRVLMVLLAVLLLPMSAESSEKKERYQVGVGVKIQKQEIYGREEVIIVEDVLPDGPAEKAGVRAGDILLAIGRLEVRGLTKSEVEKLIDEGPSGSRIWLTVKRIILQDNPSEFTIIVTRIGLDRLSWIPFGRPFTGVIHFQGGNVSWHFQVDEIWEKGTFRYAYRLKNLGKTEVYFESEVLNFALGNTAVNRRPLLIYPIFLKPGEKKEFVLETTDFPEFFTGTVRILAKPSKQSLDGKRKEGWILPKDGFWETISASNLYIEGFVPANDLNNLDKDK